MKRRLHRRSKPSASHESPAHDGHGVPRFPFNLLWVLFGVVVLAAVVFYDQRQIHQARHHIEQAAYFRQQGVYDEALNEYQKAYKNKRLGRKQKGEVALAIGDIYFDHFEKYDMARMFFEKAKQDNPKLFQDGNAQDRLKAASQKSAGAGISSARTSNASGTTMTVIQRVELLNPPQGDLRGPVIARYRGGEIHAGELLRWLKDRAEYNESQFREDPARLEQMLDQYMTRALRYQAGLDAGLQRDTDVSARLYDYQKTLISERFAIYAKQQATAITPQQARDYYEKNRAQYVRPASTSVAVIKTLTESEAQAALEQIRKGVAFGDVASSTSIDEASAKQRGVIGTVTEHDTTITAVGEAPGIAKQLVGLRTPSITGVIPANGHFFIFQVLRSSPGRATTLDEARPEIENKLRSLALATKAADINAKLRNDYKAEMVSPGLQKFWQFVAGDSRNNDSETSGTSAQAGDTTATAEQSPGDKLPG